MSDGPAGPGDDEIVDEPGDLGDDGDDPPVTGKGRRERRPPPDPGITSMREALEYADPRPATGSGPYGTRLSNALAVVVANGLRPWFPGILPHEGRGTESRARTAKGFKKLDVNYSTVELGLGLGVSIKTINYRDRETRRYTKNYTRADNELRAEAMDYHQRQPYAVMAGLLFLPVDAADDAGQGSGADANQGVSSFGAAVRHFRNRAPRRRPEDPPDLFERFFVGLYTWEGADRGDLVFYDVERPRPPRDRRPHGDEVLGLGAVLDEIRRSYDDRNNPPFDWAD